MLIQLYIKKKTSIFKDKVKWGVWLGRDAC